MNHIIIKQTGNASCNSKTVRAYEPGFGLRKADRPLGVSASTTGNVDWAAMSCAAKTFIQYAEPKAERAEIETRILLKSVVPGMIWRAELKANKIAEPSPASDARKTN